MREWFLGRRVVCVYVAVVVLLQHQSWGSVKNVHATTYIPLKKKSFSLFSVTDHTGMVEETLKQ